MYAGLITTLLLVGATTSDLTFDYYKKLLTESQDASQSYQLPKSSQEFKKGVKSSQTLDYGTFDFIIIGAGTAGSVLATRLSEIDKWKILLLEAGGEETDLSNVPNVLLNLVHSDLNWGYLTTPQTGCCLGMKDRRCMVPRGKVIGGSSSVNAMMYVRCNPEDYNKWEDLGNPGWSFKNIFPYFLKSENSQVNGDPGYHAKGGLLNVQNTFPTTDLLPYLLDANLELNQTIVDFNGRNQVGVSRIPYNIIHGKRQSTGKAFLDFSRERDNLVVLTHTLATKIIIEKSGKVAVGVEFVRNDKKYRANARLEVILSAGAYNSPQLLMLSGIGPRTLLDKLKIEVVEDLPVGQKLIEHPMFPGLVFRTNYTYTVTMDEAIEQFLHQKGLLTRPSNNDAIGFVHGGTLPPSVPMVEYIFIPPNSTAPFVPRALNFDDELSNFYKQINTQTDITFFIILLHEKSRGSVTLKSNDPTDFPIINYNFFDQPEDIDHFIEGIDFMFKLLETKALKKINAKWFAPTFCREFQLRTRKFWECVIRKMALTMFHPCGTTPMGPRAKMGVVDHDLKVHGINNLRVIDASVIPTTMSGHTNAPVIMIAEKMSDQIKGKYRVI